MAFYELTQASPESTSFSVTTSTVVQFAVTSESVLSTGQFATLQADVGGSIFESISVRLVADTLIDVALKPGVYRLSASNTDTSTNIRVLVSPTE